LQDPNWQAEARRLRAQGKTADEIAALLQQDPSAVREALRGTPSPEPFGAKPLGAGRAKLAAPHAPRVPRVTLDRTVLQAAALAFARGEIDRTELMRRIARDQAG
jgi:hypothetical protein